MQVTTVTLFRFQGFWARFWAFRQMVLAYGPLRATRGLRFVKVLGTGRGLGFSPAPNWGVYSILATWESREDAERALSGPGKIGEYRDRSKEHYTLYLEATRCHGSWDGIEPFAPALGAPAPAPLVVLTRATIRPSRLWAFWRSVPSVSGMVAGRAPLRLSLGLGERPIVGLMTFSLWDDGDSMREYAYRAGHHRETMRLAKRDGWFAEDLFVRFRVLGARGSWGGQDPYALAQAAVPEAPAPRPAAPAALEAR
ncbi:MAG: spheroidene monooxygenase [Myxococcota bacterium]